jgi:hypothetical protein
MTIYTINLTPAEDLALKHVSVSADNWIQNSVHERCRIAIDEIVTICVQKCLDNNIQIPASKDAMVELAFDQGWVKTAQELDEEEAAKRKELRESQE